MFFYYIKIVDIGQCFCLSNFYLNEIIIKRQWPVP